MNQILYYIFLVLLAGFFIYAGAMHFKKAWFFEKIVPPILKKWKKSINIISGIAEILGGIGLLIPQTRVMAAWGLIALLIAVFPANLYMYQSKGAGMKISQKFLLIRLPLQLVLIAWAFYYTR